MTMQTKRMPGAMGCLGAVAGMGLLLAMGCGDDGGGAAGAGNGGAAGDGSNQLAVQARPSAEIASFMGSGVTGKVEFDTFQENLSMNSEVVGDKPRITYAVTVGTGRSCDSEASIGEEFGSVFMTVFVGDDGSGWNNSLHAADLTDATIGGAASTNILGRVAVVREDISNAPVVGCGVIHEN